MKKFISILIIFFTTLTLTSYSRTIYANEPVKEPSAFNSGINNLTVEEQKMLEASKKDILIYVNKKFKIVPIKDFGLSHKSKIILYSVLSAAIIASMYAIYRLTL